MGGTLLTYLTPVLERNNKTNNILKLIISVVFLTVNIKSSLLSTFTFTKSRLVSISILHKNNPISRPEKQKKIVLKEIPVFPFKGEGVKIRNGNFQFFFCSASRIPTELYCSVEFKVVLCKCPTIGYLQYFTCTLRC